MRNKALYLCCIADPWIAVAKNLEKQGVIPAYIVHWKADEKRFRSAFGDECHLHAVHNAWKGLGFPTQLTPKPLDERDFKEIAWCELNALKMMDRLDPLGNQFGFQERRYFFHDLVGYWLACIDAYGLDLVVSPSVPHRVFDYALYVACKIKNIKFLMFQMVPFGSASLVIEDVDEMGPDYLFDKVIVGARSPSSLVLEKLDRVKSDYSNAIPGYMVAHERNQKLTQGSIRNRLIKPIIKSLLFSLWPGKIPSTYWVKKSKMPSASYYSWVSYFYTMYKRDKKVSFLRRDYESIVTKGVSQRYFLVALHYQPEETSCPTGGSYADQINIIKLLDDVLPEDVEIVVKEHKSQFYSHQESASGRDYGFYQRLVEISSSRVTFVSVDENPFDLIDNAIATVTISGTIGWESALRGTPALVFGRAWYEGMPRVHKIKTRSDLIGIVPKLENEKNKDLEEEILSYHGWLEGQFVRAIHYKSYMKNSDVSISESINNLTKALVERL